MGLSPVPAFANTIAGEVSRIFKAKGITAIHYTDDFLIVADSYEEAQQVLQKALCIATPRPGFSSKPKESNRAFPDY